jgi:hypothetical protein
MQTRLPHVVGIAIIAILLTFSAGLLRAADNDGWLGMDHPYANDTRALNPSYYYPQFISDLQTVKLSMARTGFTYAPTNTFESAEAAAYQQGGISPHSVLDYDSGTTTMTDSAFYTLCYNTMTEYKGEVSYYIVGNEPDLNNNIDPNNKKLSADPQQTVNYVQDAYNASRAVDSSGSIKVESAPTSNPTTTYLQSMINDGVTKYCDYLGVHCYSTQIFDGSLNTPWVYQEQQTGGGPIVPVTCSEMGIDCQWDPADQTDTLSLAQQGWMSDFLDLAYVQFKRYGYANVILFESTSWTNTSTGNTSSTEVFDLLRSASGSTTPPVVEPYSEIENYLTETDPTNPTTDNFGFENSTGTLECKHGWVAYATSTTTPTVWENATDINYQETTNPHSGAYCLQFNTSAPGERIVRRVVKATANQPITVSAWVYSNNGGQSHLRVEGYDATDGASTADNSTSIEGAWTELSVSVTPTHPWIVIELSSDADGASGSYVNFDDVNIANGTNPGVTFLDTDLDSAATGFYGSGQPNGTVINSTGTVTSQMTVAADTLNTVQIATPANASSQVLEFAQDEVSNSEGIVSKSITGLTKGSTGNNYLQGGFDFSTLQTVHNGPALYFLLNSGNYLNLSSTADAVVIGVRGLTFSVLTGGTNPPTVTLNQNDDYHVDWYLDLSSTSATTWGYTLTDLTSGGTVVDSRTNLLSRAANVTPNVMVFNACTESTVLSTTPFAWVDNPTCYTIPSIPTTELTADFDNAALGNYGSGLANGTIINSNDDTVLPLTATGDSTNETTVASINGSDHALELTYFSSTDKVDSGVSTPLTNISLGAAGNNYISGSFDFSPLLTVSNGPEMSFVIGSDYALNSHANDSVINVRGTTFSVMTGGTNPPSVALTQGSVYHVDYYVDLSSANSWGYTLTTSTGTILQQESGLSMRAPTTVVPTVAGFSTGAGNPSSTQTPYVWIDNATISASNGPPAQEP